jgi:hypothetical protein
MSSTKTSTGWMPPGDVCRRRREAVRREIQETTPAQPTTTQPKHPRLRPTLPQAGDASKSRGQPPHARAAPADARPLPPRAPPARSADGLQRSPARAPADPPKGSVHLPPQPCEDPRDKNVAAPAGERHHSQPPQWKNAQNHHDASTTHKTSLRPTTTASPWPPQDRVNNAQPHRHAVTTYSTA